MSYIEEIEESVDPLRRTYVEVRRGPILKVWVSKSGFDSGLCDRMFDVPEGTEAVAVALVATSGMNGARKPLQRLGQFVSFPGDESYSPEKVAAMFAHLGLEVVETERSSCPCGCGSSSWCREMMR